MPMENDLGTGSDFDMQDALAQMSEGLGFEADAPGAGDGDAELDGIIDNATVEAPAGKAPEAPTVAAEAPPHRDPCFGCPEDLAEGSCGALGHLAGNRARGDPEA